MTRVSIADLGRVVNPGTGQKVIALLTAYFDASWDKTAPRITVVGGYVAPIDEWMRVETEWDAGLKDWSLNVFHLSDLPRQMGKDRAALCETYFEGIIRRSKLNAIGAALFRGDWEQDDWRDDITDKLSSHYEQGLDMAFRCVGEHTKEVFQSEEVAIICCPDETEKKIEVVYERIQKLHPHIISATVGRASHIKPLQCADLGAWKLRRSWKSIASGDVEAQNVPWGVMPEGEGTRHRISLWSLHQNAVMARALKIYEKRGWK